MNDIRWEQVLTSRLSSLEKSLEFLDQCRLPENMEEAYATGALKDAHNGLEQSARELIKAIR
jgi:hypothetical protein